MCGIAGILHHDGRPAQAGDVEPMVAALRHRGPDGSGVLCTGSVALGHSRLSVIDLQGGAQPMTGAEGRLAVTFNGEIYNYKELRKELQDAGWRFRTTSDTEVLLAAYEKHGEGCVERLVGMFAFCIADFRSRRLFLARDHAGVKPLFYWAHRDFFAFGSELGALRVLPQQPSGSLQSVDFFLRYQYIPAPQTIFKEINKLEPGHSLWVDFDGSAQPPRSYWRLAFSESPGKAPEPEEVEAAVRRAVARAMVADVPVGVFLSGGLDSTCVTKLACEAAGAPVQAYSIGFEERPYNELEHARQAAEVLGVDFVSETVRGEHLDILPELLDHYGEPFGDSSAIPTWHVSRLAREGGKVVLSGDGGDELFGGYDRYFHWLDAQSRLQLQNKLLQEDRRAGRHVSSRALLDGAGYGPEAWSRYVCLTRYAARKRLWKPEYKPLADAPCPLFQKVWERARHLGGTMAYAQAMDFATYLPGAVLTKVDVAAMYHGLEVRPALLDRELMEVAARLPLARKYDGSDVGKLPLQRLLAGSFDNAFIRRRKQGFAIPAQKWLAPPCSGHALLKELFAEGRSPLEQWFEGEEIRRHVALQEQGTPNAHHLWLLLVLGLWVQRNPQVAFT